MAILGFVFCRPVYVYANVCDDIVSGVRSAFVQAFDGLTLKDTDVEWIGQKLSDAQFKNFKQFASRAKKPLKRGYTIRILTPEEVTASAEPGQIIEKNSASDWLLIEESNVNENPSEVLVIRLHLTDGKVTDTGIKVFGKEDSVDFTSAKNQLFRLLKGDASGIAEVEVVHTHPIVAVRLTDPDGIGHNRPVDLSDEDLAVTAEFADQIRHRRP